MRNWLGLLKTLLAVVVALAVVSLFARDKVFGQRGTWTVKAPIPTPRSGLAVGVVNGILHAVGGSITHFGVGGYIESLSTVEAFDPSNNSWTTKSPMPTPRTQLAVGVVGGILYALGGFAKNTQPALETMDAYDPRTNTWRAAIPLPWSPNAVGVANGILYALGGCCGPDQTSRLEAYDPIKNTWTVRAPMPSHRVGFGLGVVNGILYTVGGAEPYGPIRGTVEAYDPQTNKWTTQAPMLTPRFIPALGVANQLVYAVGGHATLQETGVVNIPPNMVEVYDPRTNVWSKRGSLPGNRNFVALGDVNGVLYAVGGVRWVPDGHDGPPSPFKIVYDPITYAFHVVP